MRSIWTGCAVAVIALTCGCATSRHNSSTPLTEDGGTISYTCAFWHPVQSNTIVTVTYVTNTRRLELMLGLGPAILTYRNLSLRDSVCFTISPDYSRGHGDEYNPTYLQPGESAYLIHLYKVKDQLMGEPFQIEVAFDSQPHPSWPPALSKPCLITSFKHTVGVPPPSFQLVGPAKVFQSDPEMLTQTADMWYSTPIYEVRKRTFSNQPSDRTR